MAAAFQPLGEKNSFTDDEGILKEVTIGPILVTPQEVSPELELSIINDASQGFIRVITHSNRAFGNVPTFEVRGGLTRFKSIPVQEAGDSPQAVEIKSDPDGRVQAVATCELDPEHVDIFLITLHELSEDSGPWKLRIKNNEQEPQSYLGFCSDVAMDTKQPWIGRLDNHLLRFRIKDQTKTVAVRNLGTTELIFHDQAAAIGDEENSALVISSLPSKLKPREEGIITFKAAKDPEVDLDIIFQLNTNDMNDSHGVVRLMQRKDPCTLDHVLLQSMREELEVTQLDLADLQRFPDLPPDKLQQEVQRLENKISQLKDSIGNILAAHKACVDQFN